MVTAVARTWSRGDQRPLEERWREAASRLHPVGGREIGPMTETNLDAMEAEIMRLTPPPAWDPLVATAASEFLATIARYAEVRDGLLRRQRRLAEARSEWAHQLLGLISDHLLVPPEQTQEMVDRLFGGQRSRSHWEPPGKVHTPEFHSVSEYRHANRLVLDELFGLEALRDRVAAVDAFESQSRPDQNRRLIEALFERVRVLEEEISNKQRRQRR